MERFVKVLMYVYRDNNGKKEFFVLHRKKGDIVALTGHVETEDENLEQMVFLGRAFRSFNLFQSERTLIKNKTIF